MIVMLAMLAIIGCLLAFSLFSMSGKFRAKNIRKRKRVIIERTTTTKKKERKKSKERVRNAPSS